MKRPIRIRVSCRVRSATGEYSGPIELSLNGGPIISLEFFLRDPLESNVDLRVVRGEQEVFHHHGDERMGELAERQQMLLFMLSQPLMETTAKVDSLSDSSATVLVAAAAHLAEATGLGEFFAMTDLTYEAGEREFDLLASLFTAAA